MDAGMCDTHADVQPWCLHQEMQMETRYATPLSLCCAIVTALAAAPAPHGLPFHTLLPALPCPPALQVKKCEKAIRAAHTANAELLSTTKTVMSLPLPQVRRGAARFPVHPAAKQRHS